MTKQINREKLHAKGVDAVIKACQIHARSIKRVRASTTISQSEKNARIAVLTNLLAECAISF